MESVEDPRQALARRLRSLRADLWPETRITQPMVARALGVSVPLISSWESKTKPEPPPVPRLEAYATLFCTPGSLRGDRLRLLGDADLTRDEHRRREELRQELLTLRAEALGELVPEPAGPAENPWRFGDGKPITIVCAQVPAEMLERMPYTNPKDPDYVEMYNFADLDALIELHGHIRALNPDSVIRLYRKPVLTADHYPGHLVLLGGVDWNEQTRKLLEDPALPVKQVADWDNAPQGTYFEVDEGGRKRTHHPVLRPEDGMQVLEQDVGYFYRGPSPYYKDSTITMCNGMYARGTLGVVKALTDRDLRDANSAFLSERFQGHSAYSVLTRVVIIDTEVLSPDWTLQENRLHEWPPAGDAAR
ncbi:helix-turn-helix transcriptional regulator [Nonomuraea sp. NPDC048916]|uniref:helix-turn-helix domain-containing protein n=1 Tax=Nonomuraea sp. NPDC048916 TaxID=3154232 RepID=UPI0033EA0224